MRRLTVYVVLACADASLRIPRAISWLVWSPITWMDSGTDAYASMDETVRLNLFCRSILCFALVNVMMTNISPFLSVPLFLVTSSEGLPPFFTTGDLGLSCVRFNCPSLFTVLTWPWWWPSLASVSLGREWLSLLPSSLQISPSHTSGVPFPKYPVIVWALRHTTVNPKTTNIRNMALDRRRLIQAMLISRSTSWAGFWDVFSLTTNQRSAIWPSFTGQPSNPPRLHGTTHRGFTHFVFDYLGK